MITRYAAILWSMESPSLLLAHWSGFYWIGKQQPASVGSGPVTGNLYRTDDVGIKILLPLYH